MSETAVLEVYRRPLPHRPHGRRRDRQGGAGVLSAASALKDVVGAHKATYSVPDEQVTATVDVGPWMEQKIAAVLAHRTEVQRGAVPGLIAGL
ncbi:hypothetical protein [Streptomyces sp. Ag109_G2-15]|uniref:hypothetical protein n=1 Tax=Streptomyces sp. Ag109_G2-15 TaxID=1938850 RepID=UPI0026B7E3DE|nr:hypothetical protein [Streptomyces sp. Ag109_G2-15]